MFPNKLVERLWKYGCQVSFIERSARISDNPLLQNGRQKFSEIFIASTALRPRPYFTDSHPLQPIGIRKSFDSSDPVQRSSHGHGILSGDLAEMVLYPWPAPSLDRFAQAVLRSRPDKTSPHNSLYEVAAFCRQSG
jgi:hypothetical protein